MRPDQYYFRRGDCNNIQLHWTLFVYEIACSLTGVFVHFTVSHAYQTWYPIFNVGIRRQDWLKTRFRIEHL